MRAWFLYIIENDKGYYYTGITTDIERRFNEHKSDKKKRAKFFRSSKPVKIIYSEQCESRSAATKREIQIKKMSKVQKIAMIKAANL